MGSPKTPAIDENVGGTVDFEQLALCSVCRHPISCFVVFHVGNKLLDIESDFAGELWINIVVENRTVLKDRIVHLPKRALEPGGLGREGGGDCLGMVAQGKMLEEDFYPFRTCAYDVSQRDGGSLAKVTLKIREHNHLNGGILFSQSWGISQVDRVSVSRTGDAEQSKKKHENGAGDSAQRLFCTGADHRLLVGV